MQLKQLLESGILAQVSRYVEADDCDKQKQLNRLLERCYNYYNFKHGLCEKFNDELLDQLSDGQDKIELEQE